MMDAVLNILVYISPSSYVIFWFFMRQPGLNNAAVALSDPAAYDVGGTHCTLADVAGVDEKKNCRKWLDS